MKKFVRKLVYCVSVAMIISFFTYAGAAETVFKFEAIDVTALSGWFTTDGQEILVDWGDGTSNKFSGNSKRYSKKYEEKGSRAVTITSESKDALLGFRMEQSGENIKFDLSDLPRSMTYLHCSGLNSVTGDIKDLPSGLTYYYCEGYNTTKGDISNLPKNLTFFSSHGRNTLKGNLKDFPQSLTYLRCFGRSSISGDIKDLPPNLTEFLFGGYGNISGDISNLPKELTNFYCTAKNSITGDISKFPKIITNIYWNENDIQVEYTSGREWAPKMLTVHIRPRANGGLSTNKVDALLIDLAKTTWAGTKRVWLGGNNEPRSNASDEAVSKLKESKVSVTCNVANPEAAAPLSPTPKAVATTAPPPTLEKATTSVFFSGKEYVVSKNGSDKNLGTPEKPFATIKKAIETARAGDKISVKAGIYYEKVNFPRSGTSEKPIILSGERGKNGEFLTSIDAGVKITNWEPAPEVGSGVYKTKSLNFNPQIMTLGGQHLLRIADRHMKRDFGKPIPAEPVMLIGNYSEREKSGFGGFGLLRLDPKALVKMSEARGGSIPYWDGVEIVYGYMNGTTYIRFRDRDNPNGKNLSASEKGAAVLIDNCSHIIVRDLEIRGAETSLIIQGEKATNNIVEHNRMLNGRGRVLVTDKAARNIIQNNYMTLNYIGHRQGVNNWLIYHEFKHTSGGNMSDDQGITLQRAGVDNIVRDNRIDQGLIGIDVIQTQRAYVYRNLVSRMSSIGLCTERGNQDCFFYDNILFNNAINLRIHSYWAPGFARREYHFRNILYQSPKRGGVHMFVHYRTEPWPGEPEDPELFIYHNTFSGGSPTMITTRGFNIAAANKHRKTVLINNVFSSPGRSLSEPVFWSNPEVFEAMDYNWLALAFGQPARGAKQPKWFGEHNITQEGRLLWETGMINFTLPETSAARNSGIDLSKPFSICGKDYSALPGMEPGYFSGKAPHMGALQEGKTLSADVMSELKME